MGFKTLLRSTLTIGVGVLAVLPSLTALAAPPPDVFKDSRGNVYIHGTLASSLNSSARAQTDDPLTRSVRAGYCGEVRISPSTSLPSIGDSWMVNSQTIQRSNLPVISDRSLLPTCSGNTFDPALTPAITSAGGFIDSTTTVSRVVLTGYSPGISYPVLFNDVGRSISLSQNACGFYRISNTTANPAPASMEIDGQSYTTASLTVAAPPLCIRDTATGNYTRYNPSTW